MTPSDWDRLARSLEYPAGESTARQEDYVQTFDFDPDCSLDVGWHLYGDRPERGVFLAALRSDLASAQIDEAANLPDYLPTLLRLCARLPAAPAAALAATIAPAAARVLERVRARGSGFAEPLEQVMRALDAMQQEEQRP